MQLALSLGRRGLGRTWPNPAVGSVVVKDGVVLARAWTHEGGRPHAETQALAQAGEAARGATLYVTLEPCSHHGKTPPCADAIIAAGITRVVSALDDPNPDVAGQGHARIREAGIELDVGICAEEARRDHAGHICRITEGRPYVTLKLALSADGKIGASGRRPFQITGEQVRTRVHMFRAQSDAILVGVGTARADNPQLTCRLPGLEQRSPVRVILDRHLRLPASSYLAKTARKHPVWVFSGGGGEPSSATLLAAEGVEIIHAPVGERGIDLQAMLQELGRRGVTRLMVEGGARVAASFVEAGLVDEVWLYRGPVTIGADGVAALDRLPLTAVTQSPHYRVRATETLGQDTLTIYEHI
ncbi:bifunctional diaminohydroxyphosphoribosylaminopyrimidine deaminase/5-amino-6-(5-phosphoribosylamino)uracil reductase RibD [Bradyrhizobium sp. LHD-71]|uniref:bifunctional diaminohydroxyphosphoribosylaminopyrimidine deaminase/5-amino-6-(5-phosphoribosylamino)uracil reductase RibD n=1 Tax=Bradyrhizobium sp. LHD-71 TaxID=3072141 RepID=UPI00280DE5F1|nr:bifunctional diaminohydroxyphosphoribosylaminopyrimidine deaminase/5-amino-6-(5-phosphoribosylamino)uracil reductase RibD [Bradyrhizobium sp. LHD-71]MDQ8726149.1 bifunctional diaminohydroxyphosphoribosylaminopyrimidine deaminase/5-amino-6-(5-phosphoribosylamino)uracil reductase RibD [Bradyrhizobium sp. LHD-71]